MPQRKAVPSLRSLCLGSLAGHMQSVWVKDYSDNYLDEYRFRFVMGPFEQLAGGLVQELIRLLGESRRLTRAALHLLLVPHLRELSLRACPALASNAIAQLVAVRCKSLSALDLHGCGRLSADALVDLLEGLPLLRALGLAETQANLQVLSAAGSCCPRLRQLDVSRCKKVTPRALLHVAHDPLAGAPCGPELRVLLARGLEPAAGPEVTAALAFLLLALPRLEFLAHGAVPDALRLLHEEPPGAAAAAPGFPSLQELARRRRGPAGGARLALPLRRVEELEAPALEALCALCPDAEDVAAWLGDEAGAGWAALRGGRLARLSLACAGPRGWALARALPLARDLGPRLRALALHGFCYEDEFALGALLAACPHLQSFSTDLQPPTDAGDTGDAGDAGDAGAELSHPAAELLPGAFPQLQSFSLALVGAANPLPARHGRALLATLAALLCRAPRLQRLRLLAVPVPLDAALAAALAAPALQELQELSLAGSRVASGTVALLLAADSRLRRLDLARCPDVLRRDYDAFARAARRRRLDLHIAWE